MQIKQKIYKYIIISYYYYYYYYYYYGLFIYVSHNKLWDKINLIVIYACLSGFKGNSQQLRSFFDD